MRTNEKWEDTREGWMDVGEGGGTNRAKQLPRGRGKVKQWGCYNENDRVEKEGEGKKERKIQLTIPFKSYGDAEKCRTFSVARCHFPSLGIFPLG